jgi:hypothetical protein
MKGFNEIIAQYLRNGKNLNSYLGLKYISFLMNQFFRSLILFDHLE